MNKVESGNDKRHCLNCNNEIRGRTDKKFCDDYCRNVFNNHKKAGEPHRDVVRNINNILLKNRRILASFLSNNPTAKITREDLLGLGFNFNFYTNSYTTRTGKIYRYCYDCGYLATGNDWYLVVNAKQIKPFKHLIGV